MEKARVSPFLSFTGKAEEAMRFYTDHRNLFGNRTSNGRVSNRRGKLPTCVIIAGG